MEAFFYESASRSPEDVRDLIFRRYGGASPMILAMELDEFLPLLETAEEKEQEERLWQMWVSVYPNMDRKSYIPFEKFRDEAMGKNIDRRTDAEILADVTAAERELRGGDEDGT